MELSKNDRYLLGNDPDSFNIQPNSMYDDSIAINDSTDSEGNPSGYSPRPNIGDSKNGRGGQYTGNFDFDFSKKFQDSSFVDNNTNLGNSSPSFGNNSPSFGNYSPRPKHTDNLQYSSSNPELAKLFGLISQFQPNPPEMTPHFKPFIPDLIPSIGAIDAFIKVPRPDDETEYLGLTILDEPTIGTTDPQIMKMQLREKYGVSSSTEADGFIGFIKDLDNNQKALDQFLESYEELIRNRPAPSMVYTSQMPDIEEIMAEWPEELEKALKTLPLPSSEIDLSLEEYIKVICSILDIPIKGNIVESLHLLFSLYQIFDENHHFSPNLRGSTPNKNW